LHQHHHSNETQWPPLSLVILAILMLVGLGLLGHVSMPVIQTPINPNQETVEARVIEVVEQGTFNQGGLQQPYQKLRLQILTGQRTGQEATAEYGTQNLGSSAMLYQPDDQVEVLHTVRPDGTDSFTITEPNRWGPLLTLLILFVVVIVAVSRWKGVRSLVGLCVSLYVITQFILPMILSGADAVLVTILGAFALLSVTEYLIYGWTAKTHAAVLGILISLIITGVLSVVFVNATRLTGYGSEEVSYLQTSGATIDPRGLLLAGILIGALGVLDDVTISQASSVFELSGANPTLGVRELYRRAMNIGRDHIASTVNTLVLAYVGASLPLFLLFAIYPQPFGQIINIEFVTEEVMRTLIGSLGLVLAVPITTVLAGMLTGRKWM
jgi:uncharacterized membrane protein